MRTEDGYLIHKCLNGEPEAFGFLVDKYKTSVYAFAYSQLWNFHDAEDITQEVFLQAFRKLHTLKHWDSFRAWLYVITSNLCKKFIRKNHPDGEFFSAQDANPFDYYSMNSYQEKQIHELLHEALDPLPEMYRQVLTLYYIGGLSGKEIAQFLGTSPSTIRQRLSRARAKLKKEMLDMMSKTYEQHKLQPSFTFQIVEMVKQIKIQPAPRSTPLLPFGLSAATGIILTALMFSSHLISLTPLGALLGSPLPSETKVMETGELPVDVLEISEITFLSSEQGDDDGGVAKLPNPQNAFAPPLAPQTEGGTWTQKADMPTPRGAHATCVFNGNIYVIGGADDGNNVVAKVEVYDPVTDTWTQKADMPTGRGGHAASIVNGKIYVIGGWDGGKKLSTIEEYNPKTDTWTRKTDMPTPRPYLGTCAVNGKIYAIGGWAGANLPGLLTVEEYDLTADRWTRKADMPTGRVGLATAAVNGKIYAIGGTANWEKGPDLSVVEEYDPVTDTWTKKADMLFKRYRLSVAVVNGNIYAIGGFEDPGGPANFFHPPEVYDPATNTWTELTDMQVPRQFLSSSTVNGKIYAIGGWGEDNKALSLVEEYTPEGWPFSVSPHGKLSTTWGEMKTGK